MLCIAPVLLNHETIEHPLVLDLTSFFRQQLHISNANVSYVSAAKKTTPTTICEVSNFLGTVHHEYVFTIEEALDALPDVKGPKGLRSIEGWMIFVKTLIFVNILVKFMVSHVTTKNLKA